jgi:hypothetical protein
MAQFCGNCGSPVEEEAVFCGRCGAQQQTASVSARPPMPVAVSGPAAAPQPGRTAPEPVPKSGGGLLKMITIVLGRRPSPQPPSRALSSVTPVVAIIPGLRLRLIIGSKFFERELSMS